MPFTDSSLLRLQPRRRLVRSVLAAGIVALATGARFAVDPLVHDQIPYFTYVASVVIATWLCGVLGGTVSTLLTAFTGHYFFVEPRYRFSPSGEDWIAMGMVCIVGLGLVWLVGRWRLAEAQVRVATIAAEVGVWTWTPGTSRVSVRGNWRTLFGVAPDAKVTLDTWAAALHPDDREHAIDSLKTAWRDQREFQSEYRTVSPEGTVRWIIDRGRPIFDASGAVVGMAGVNVDITKRRTAEEAAHLANRLKDEFLATLSHELRTPLNAIVGWSDMLRRHTLQSEQADKAMESVYRNAKTLSEMINDVLDVSRIMSGKVRIEMQPVDPAAVLQSAIESVRSAADAKGVAIVTDRATVPFPLSGDPVRLQQVFWNLLTNAVKFTPSGGQVRVSLRLSGEHVRVQVSDTGTGISPEFLPHVFERFRQRDSSSTRQDAGLGLGLAIVHQLVELHGGTVQAESTGEGRGATFTVRLPAQRFEERRHARQSIVRPVPAVEPVSDDAPSLCRARVLIVDDESETREVTAAVLQHHGASVAVVADAQQALSEFNRFDPTVLLIDVAMPGIDGYGLIERIRTSCGERGKVIPAIAFTAYAREEDQRRALTKGFQLHLAKPVDSHTLVRAVASVQPAAPSR